jgi:hypothetical protein
MSRLDGFDDFFRLDGAVEMLVVEDRELVMSDLAQGKVNCRTASMALETY